MLLAVLAVAGAAPVALNYQGRVAGALGTPVDAPSASVEVELFDAETGGASRFDEAFTTPIENGYFEVVLGALGGPDHTDLAGDVWVEVTVDGVLLGPRQRLTDTPRAALAVHAESADSVPTPYAVPIGGIVPWWRPDASVPIPDGYVPADGRTITTHGFPVAGAITVPDLRNAFVLGADVAVADGGSGSSGNAAANSPGIGGTGGSNAQVSLAHTHGATVSGTTGGAGAHSHTVSGTTSAVGGHAHGIPFGDAGGGASWQRNWPHYGNTSRDLRLMYDTDPNGGAVSVYATTTEGGHDHTYSATSSGVTDHTHTFSASTTTGSALGSTDVRPRYVGLLYLIRVM